MAERNQGVKTQRMNLQRGEDKGLRLIVMIISCKENIQISHSAGRFPGIRGDQAKSQQMDRGWGISVLRNGGQMPELRSTLCSRRMDKSPARGEGLVEQLQRD